MDGSNLMITQITPVKLNGLKCEIMNLGIGLIGLEKERLVQGQRGRGWSRFGEIRDGEGERVIRI